MAYHCNYLLFFVWLLIVKLTNIFYYCEKKKKEKYCIGNWNVRSMNQGKLEVVKQDTATVNTGILGISSVQSLSRVRLFVTPWTTAHQASLSITNSQSLPKPISIKLVMPSNHLILCHPLLLLPSIFPSIRVFSSQLFASGGQSIGVSASISVLSMKLISFRMDWLDLLKVQGTLKNLLQLLGISELK